MFLDSSHQVLPEDLPALQEACGCELCGTTSGLCKGKTTVSPGHSTGQPMAEIQKTILAPTPHAHSQAQDERKHPGPRSRLTLVQQGLYGELVIRSLDTVLESGDVALLAEAIRGGIHSFDLAHVALFKAPTEKRKG